MFAARSFSNWSIAAKLNFVQAMALISLLIIVIASLTLWLGTVLEEKSLASIRQANQQALDMLSAYNSAMEKNVERLGNILMAGFPAGFSVDDGNSIDIGGIATPRLKSGNTVLNLNFDGVDAYTATTQAVATIFARQGDDFVRVTTSLKKENGERAVGTLLGPSHPAYATLLKGQPFTGKARLFGHDYMTRYLPQMDQSGRIAAVVFIGLDFTSELATLKERIRSVKFGRTGYIFALDAGKDKGNLVIHPTQEGTNLLGARDASGRAFVSEMIEKMEGTIRYQFANTGRGETQPREKVAVFTPFPHWNWVLASSSYRDELVEEVVTLRNQLIVGVTGLALLLVLTLFFSTHRWVSRPLSDAVAAMQSIAGGNLAVRIPPHGEDETGRLLSATQAMAGSMADAIGDIQNAAHKLVDCACHLSETSSLVASKSGLQSDAASAMAASIEEMNTSISHVADNAQTAEKISGDSGKISGEGAAVIRQAIDSMTRIADTVRSTSRLVAKLGKESEAISVIVNVIKGIADQTNLLALNAAIEAARAGEAGRGFSVVADAARKLAESTASSTREIESMISRIQSGTSEAIDSMQNGVTQAQEGVAFADQTGNSITDIHRSTDQVAQAVADISAALSEQTLAAADIARNVEQISAMADDNKRLAQSSDSYAKELKQLADSLNQRVSRFIINS